MSYQDEEEHCQDHPDEPSGVSQWLVSGCPGGRHSRVGVDAEDLAGRLQLSVDGDDAAWYREQGSEEVPLEFFDAVMMRKDPPFDAE